MGTCGRLRKDGKTKGSSGRPREVGGKSGVSRPTRGLPKCEGARPGSGRLTQTVAGPRELEDRGGQTGGPGREHLGCLVGLTRHGREKAGRDALGAAEEGPHKEGEPAPCEAAQPIRRGRRGRGRRAPTSARSQGVYLSAGEPRREPRLVRPAQACLLSLQEAGHLNEHAAASGGPEREDRRAVRVGRRPRARQRASPGDGKGRWRGVFLGAPPGWGGRKRTPQGR